MDFYRQYAIPHNNQVLVSVPEEFNNREVEILILPFEEKVKNQRAKATPKPKVDMSRFVGILKDMPDEDKEHMMRELSELRDSWERDIF